MDGAIVFFCVIITSFHTDPEHISFYINFKLSENPCFSLKTVFVSPLLLYTTARSPRISTLKEIYLIRIDSDDEQRKTNAFQVTPVLNSAFTKDSECA